MRIEKVLITPSIAEEFLSRNNNNRKVKERKVVQYATDILDGCWVEDTGELIKISESGLLLDGQHRLLAIVRAKKPVSLHIAYDCKDEIMPFLDTGVSRSASDVLTINKISHATTLPTMISNYEAFRNGFKSAHHANYKLTNHNILSIYNLNPTYWQEVAKFSHLNYKVFSRILSPSIIGAFTAFFDEISKKDSREFINQLCSGLNIENNSVALLRNKLIDDKMSQSRVFIDIRNAWIIKGWNFFRRNNEVKIFKFDPSKEDFPIAI